MPSLLTYLEPAGNTFYLNISLSTQNTSIPENNFFPFVTINDFDPLARIIEGRVASDAGSDVKKLFLFVQRDLYALKKNALWPFNNNDVGDSWQKSFSFYVGKKREDPSFVLLADQLGKKGELLPFSSLFYCRTTKVFFHPPCPKCGRTLQQCEDDNLLRTSGLHPFSTSLKRYLFCPVCGSPDFFSYEMEDNAPSFLKDRRTLIKSFGELDKSEEMTAFPCIGCHLHEECYQKGNSVLTRMVPFSFYPFYMFAFEAASLNSLDFIALISGANFQETESLPESDREFGRVASLKAVEQACAGNTPFLFDRDERYFLEILYLKLVFLEEVIGSFQSGGEFVHPDLKPGIDQIWVKFPEINGMLPYFWNFKIKILGISGHASSPSLSKPMSDSIFLMGLVWFYTLLTNKRQNMSDVFVHLEKFSTEENVSFEKFINESVFDPLNIFWDPQGRTIKSSWNSFWNRSLTLGWSLLNSSFQTDDRAGEKFLQAMQELRKDIKENLFPKEIPHAATAPSAAETVSRHTENNAIHGILVDIIKKLEPTLSKKKEGQENKVDETVFPTAARKPEKTPMPPPVIEYMEEPVTETVILSARPSAKKDVRIPPVEKTLKSPQTVPAPESEDEKETLIISLKDLEHKTTPQSAATEELMAETVIISPAKPPAKEAEITESKAQQETMPDEEFLEETVILKPGEKSKYGTKK